VSEPHGIFCVHGENDLDYPDGYLMLTRAIGANPDDRNGENFRRFPHTKIVRLNYGYAPAGTIPTPDKYEDFAQRVRNYVEFSTGCHIWIIGNEPNMEVERPQGQPILPEDYAECYTLCRDAIKSIPYNSGDQVLLAPIAPWNIQTGDWIAYFEAVQHALGTNRCDGFAIHAYWREQTPESVSSSATMEPPYEDRLWSFRHYINWMAAIQYRFQGLPVYITEMCTAGEPWEDINTGCVQRAYREIDGWNRQYPDRPIFCAALYRWEHDQWAIHDKPRVHADFYAAVERGYTVPPTDPDPEPPEEDDMLQNPSFEEGWYSQTPDGILVLPEHWRAEYQEGDAPYKRPEIKPNEEFVTDGRMSIRAFPPAHSRGYYGIWQEIEAVPGQWYKFSADVRLESDPDGRLAGFVGIQPWGAGIFERQMIWGQETQTELEFQRVEVIAQAFGGKIRVVMGAHNEFATRNNTTWWDNARLEIWECDGGTEPEPPDPEPPEPGECPYDEDRLVNRIDELVQDAIAARDPVVWPKT
jgi:hypothetical protein